MRIGEFGGVLAIRNVGRGGGKEGGRPDSI